MNSAEFDWLYANNADGWVSFDDLAAKPRFDWEDAVKKAAMPHIDQTQAESRRLSVFFTDVSRFPLERVAMQANGWPIADGSCVRTAQTDMLAIGGEELLSWPLCRNGLAGVAIDLCGTTYPFFPEAVIEHPKEALDAIVDFANSLCCRSLLILADDSGVWPRTRAMLLYAAAKRAGHKAKIALFRPDKAQPESIIKRRLQIVLAWATQVEAMVNVN